MNRKPETKQSITRFGEKLRTLRTRHKLTLQGLAHLMGHSAHGYLSELESGKKLPTVDFVLRLARFFNITTDELLKDELELEIEDGTRATTNRSGGREDTQSNIRPSASDRSSEDTRH
ncbi:MAG: helix-turn-helix domain-containing protein [Ktedonobacteraceae bacterium]